MVKNLRLLETLFSLGSASALVSLVSLEPVFAQTVTINCQSGCTNNVANAVAVITGAGGTINSLTIDDNPGTGTPISDLSGLSVLTGLTGNLNVRRIGQNGATITNLSGLSNLASVGGTITIGGSATNANPALIDIGLSGLASVGANFTISHNPNVTSIAYPGVSVAGALQISSNALVSSISGFTGTVGNVSMASNGALNGVNLGFSAVTGNLTVQNNGTGVSSLTFPNLMTVGGSISMNNVAANAVTAVVDFPSLTGVTGNLFLIRVLGSLNAPLLTNVSSELRISTNSTFTNFDASFPSLTGVGSLTIQNNSQLSTCCRVLCQVAVSGSRTISGNAPGCQSMANINATCTPTACPSNQTRSTDIGECNYTATGGEFNVTCPVSSISYALSGATTGTYSNLNGVDFNIGTTTVTVTVTAPGGSTATCAFTVAVNETEPPAITCPPDQTLPLGDSCSAALPDYTDDATASDNCGTPTVTQAPAIATSYTAPQTVTVTLTATDGSGNTATCTFTVSVEDDTPPTITCPPDQTLSLNASCSATLPDYTDDATASDNCGTLTVTQAPAMDTLYTAPQTVTVTLTATDGEGNTSTCTFVVSVVDDTAPEIACPVTAPEVLYLDAGCSAELPDYGNLVSDNCGPAMVNQVPGVGTTYNSPGGVTVTLTATDDSGNTTTCTFAVDIVDGMPPSITCPDDQTLSLGGGCSITLPDYTDDATASDNCGTPTVTQDPAIGTSYTAPQTVTVTLTATDGSGNTATCTFTVGVEDDTSPTITCPPDQTLSLNASCSATLPDYADDATASDNCGTLTVTQAPAMDTLYTAPQTVTVTLTATDEEGNTSTCTFVVSVVDDTAPEIACPVTEPEVLPLDTSCSAELPDYSYLVSDNCGLADVTQEPEAGETYNGPQTVTVTLTATDDSGNTSTCTFEVVLQDNLPPVAACPDDITQDNDTGECGAVVEFMFSATDNCSVGEVEAAPASGSLFPVGETTVVVTATDSSGNTGTCSFTVTIVDEEDPVAVCPDDIIQGNDPAECSAMVVFTLPNPTDNCPGATSEADPPSGTVFVSVGMSTTITVTATDAAGNTAICTFTVTVEDDEAPLAGCPGDILQENDLGECGALVDFDLLPTTDNCPGATSEADPPSGSFFPVGVTVVIVTATDEAGNTHTCTFEVVVEDTEAPVVTCPEVDNPYLTDAGECFALLPFAAEATDNCGEGEVAVVYSVEGDTIVFPYEFPVGVTTVLVTVTDESGNATTCEFVVEVVDEEDPVVTCPEVDNPYPAEAGECFALLPFEAEATDDCGGVEVVYMVLGDTIEFPYEFPVGSTTVLVVATDESGNEATCEFVVEVVDEEDPVVTCPEVDNPYSTEAGECFALLPFAAEATDNCGEGEVAVVYSVEGDTIVFPYEFPVGVTTVLVTATDDSGNTSTCTFDIIVVDNEDPVVACPEPLNPYPAEAGECFVELSFAAEAEDNCGGVDVVYMVLGDTIEFPYEFPVGVTTVLVTVTDESGNEATCEFVVEVADEEEPVLECPETQTLSLGLSCSVSLPDYTGLATASDNCGVLNVSQTPGVGAGYTAPGEVTVVLTARDTAGNTATCTFVVEVVDNTAPTVNCPFPLNPYTAEVGECYKSLEFSAEAFDNCSISEGVYTVEGDEIAFPFDFPVGTTVVLFTATDINGNTATCTFVVIVRDEEDPVVTCPESSEPYSAEPGECFAELTFEADAGDNCGIAEIAYFVEGEPIEFPYEFPVGTTTVEVVVTDEGGNTSICAFVVEVADNEDPVAICPEPLNPYEAEEGDCFAELTFEADGEDNCGVAEIAYFVGGDAIEFPYEFPVGTTTVEVVVTDESGNAATCVFEVEVVDEVPPMISCPPAQTLVLGPTCSASLPDYTGLAEASDNCSETVTVTQAPLPGTTVSGVGAMTVTLTVDDGSGNTAMCTFVVNKADNTAPSITCPATQTLPLGPMCSATLPDYTGLATTSDGCSATVTVTQTPAAGTTVSGAGAMTVTLTANDGNGNTATCSFTVNKVDGTPPVFTFVPGSVIVQCNSIPTNPGSPTATDACGSVTITYNGPTVIPGSCSDARTIIHTWTATDASGNTATATRTVTVVDTQKPNFTSVPANITVECDNLPPVGTPIATDNCDNDVAITYNGQTRTNGACPNQYILTRRWTASDNCGNTRSTSQVITVVDTTKPVFTSVPANTTIQCSDPVPPVGAATATDNCGGVTVQYLGETTINGSCPNKYQIRRTWRATDQCGNSTVTVQLIQVDDTTPPIFTFVPPDVTILCTEPLPPLVNPTASDNCPGPVNITFLGSTPTGSGCESTYTVTRRWRAEDLCGNSAIATQVITVQSTPFSPEEVEERDAVKPQAPLWDDDRILTLQPNPTTDRVLIGLGSFAGERVVVSIHNEMGQLIYERAVEATSDLMIPVSLRESGATPGLFTVSVRSSGRVVAKRLVLLE